MNLKKMNIRQAIALIYKAIKGHVGAAGDGVHESANENLNGFMTSDHVKKLNEAKGSRSWVSKIDVLSLSVGNYEGNQLENTPDMNAIYEIDVREGSSSRKQVWLTESGTGKIFYRNWHTNGIVGNSPNTWTSINREVTLWSGSQSEVGAKMSCIQNPRVYSKLRIEIDLNGSGIAQTTILGLTNNKAYGVQGVNLSDSLASTTMEVFELNISIVSGEIDFTIVNNRKVNFSNDGATIQTTGLASIIGIYGIQ